MDERRVQLGVTLVKPRSHDGDLELGAACDSFVPPKPTKLRRTPVGSRRPI
jgi:hypothetical protein